MKELVGKNSSICESGFKSFFDKLEDIVLIMSLEGMIVYSNEAANHKLGHDRQNLMGKKLLECFPQSCKERAKRLFIKVSKKEPEICELPLQKQDGSLLMVETKLSFGKWGEEECIFGIFRDLTNQQIAFQKFYKLFDCNPAIMAVVTIEDERFADVNAAFIEVIGYELEEVFGRKMEELNLFVDPLEEDKIKKEIRLKGNIHNYELKLRKKDGSMLEGLFSGEIIDNYGTKSLLVVIVDRTKQKQVQKELRESEMRLNVATSNAEIGLWEWHIKTQETYFNEQWANLIGYTLSDISPVSSQTWSQFVHPHDLAISQNKIEGYLAGKTEYYECEVRVKHKSGKWIWVLARGKIVEWDEGGNPELVLGTHVNINYIKEIEQQLLEEKNKKEVILSAVALAGKELLDEIDYYKAIKNCFRILGEATEVDRVYLFQNSYDKEGKGTTSQKIEWTSSASIAQMRNPDLQDIPFEAIETFLAPLKRKESFSGLVREFEDEGARKILESQGILSIVTLPIYINHIFWGFVGFDECKYERIWTQAEFSTLSTFANSLEKAIERRLIEEELKKSKKAADEANRAKSLFLANMSHEIRTPINGILGIIDLLTDDSLSNEQRIYIDLLRKSTESLVNIINDILDLSKIESGNVELAPIKFNLRVSIREVIKVMVPLINQRNLTFSIHIAEDIPTYLTGDFEKIKQILLNLLSNAVKFTLTGEIKVSVKGERMKEGIFLVEFSVEDTGEGIAEDKINTIFEPFVQADSTISRKYGGTGLGLSICQKLVEMLQGEMWIKSVEGVGTTVGFIIPLEEVEDAECVEADQVIENIVIKRAIKPLHVLVAEDNDVNQLIVCKFLQKGGHTFKLANNGKEAVKLYAKEKFDIILMDIQMPEMDGYTATSIIREREKNEYIPIVALTAHAMKGHYEKCLEAGMNYYLTKPVSYDRLIELFYEIFGEEVEGSQPEPMEIIDVKRIFEKLDSDSIFFKLMVEKFKENNKRLMKEIQQAILIEDKEQLRFSAHALKGAVAVFEGNREVIMAKELEEAGHRGDFEKAGHLADQLQTALLSMIDNFESFIKDYEMAPEGEEG